MCSRLDPGESPRLGLTGERPSRSELKTRDRSRWPDPWLSAATLHILAGQADSSHTYRAVLIRIVMFSRLNGWRNSNVL